MSNPTYLQIKIIIDVTNVDNFNNIQETYQQNPQNKKPMK